MGRWKIITFLALQIILVKSSPFPEAINKPVDTASRTDSEANAMDVDVTALSKEVNQQNAAVSIAEQNIDVPEEDANTEDEEGTSPWEEEASPNLRENEAIQEYEEDSIENTDEDDDDREGGEYKEEENLRNSRVTEGDIYKDRSTTKILEALESGDGRDAITSPVRLWPGGKVPYVFGRVSYRVKSAFKQAIAEYNKHTCVRVVPRSSETSYIVVVSAGGCWSSLGKSGGMQKISLGRGCEHKGTAIHELMHALGFFHEQSRRDRDSYITIHWNNIMPGRENNFKKYRHGKADTLNEPYDYGSIMHYPRKAFSKNGKETIATKTSGVSIGQRRTFSVIDIRQINKLYKCKGIVNPTKMPTTKPGPCVDFHAGCKIWAKRRFCVSGRYIRYMKIKCKKSCGLCSGTVVPKCFDAKSSCPKWAKVGFCVSKYTLYMNRNCAKSCKKC